MITSETITSHLVPDADRVKVTSKLFGLNFPMRLEPFVFDVTGRLAAQYTGGFWLFHTLSNTGFYMGLRPDRVFAVSCENGFEGWLRLQALFGKSTMAPVRRESGLALR